MHTLIPYSGQAIFIKTVKGHDEIAQRRFGLNARQRRALIVMDGTKNLSAIEALMPTEELEEVISFLVEQGFIAQAENERRTAASAHAESSAARVSAQSGHYASAHRVPTSNSVQRAASGRIDESALLQDEEKIRQVKDFMTTTATTYLGLLSADVIHRIERAKGAAHLMTVVGYWHMALRESKQGNRFAGPYLEQVTAALTGKAAHSETVQA